MVDSLHFRYHRTHSLCQASPILAVMSCCLHACLSINLSVCLFSACLSLCLTAYLSLHLNEFVHASLIRHHLCISLPLCSDAVIPILDLLKEACCPCFVLLSLPTASPLMYSNKHSTYRTHSRQHPHWPVLMYNLHPITVLPLSFHPPPIAVGPSLQLSSSHFFFYGFPPKVL